MRESLKSLTVLAAGGWVAAAPAVPRAQEGANPSLTGGRAVELSPIEVRDAAPVPDASQEPTAGYRAEGSSALGPDLTLQEMPATVNVLTRDFLDDLGARSLSDGLVFVPSVTTGDNQGGSNELFVVRGFPIGSTYLNGLRQGVTSDRRRSLAVVERVEVLKGPAGADVALPSFGGTINVVTKKPRPDRAAVVTGKLGDYHYREAVADLTGPVTVDRSLQYRLIGSFENSAAWRDGRPDETPRLTFAPSLEWEYAPGSNVLLEYEHIYSDEPLDRGIVYLRDAGFNNDFTPRRWSIHQEQDSYVDRSHRLDLDANHRLNDTFALRLRAQRFWSDGDADAFRNGDTEGEDLFLEDGLTWNGNRTIGIDLSRDRYDLDSTSLQGTLETRLELGPTEHTVLTGLAYNDSQDRFLSADNDFRFPITANTVDLFDPDNDQEPEIVGFEIFPDFARGERLHAAFAQWLARWTPRWRTVLSVRQERARTWTKEEFGDEAPPADYPFALTDDQSTDTNPSIRLAISFDLLPSLTAFAGYSDAHTPQSGVTRGGGQLDARRGRSVEAGLKASLARGRVLWTNSVFQLEEDNIATTDPTNVGNENFSILLGETRVRGLESELVGSVTRNLELGAGAAFLDSEITKSDQGFEGNRFPNTPRVQLSAFASYRWAALGLPSLRTHAGVVRVGGREANSANEYRLPAYTRVDVGADVELGAGFTALLRVENLLDETYYTAAQDSGSGSDQVGVGDRRLVQVGLRWVF